MHVSSPQPCPHAQSLGDLPVKERGLDQKADFHSSVFDIHTWSKIVTQQSIDKPRPKDQNEVNEKHWLGLPLEHDRLPRSRF